MTDVTDTGVDDQAAERPARNRSGRKTQDQLAARQARDALVKEMMESERAAADAKTAKLRALRLAKEETDREAAQQAALDAPPKAPKKPRMKRAG